MIAISIAMIGCKRAGSAAEYALLLSLICVALIGGASVLGTAIAAPITAASTALTP